MSDQRPETLAEKQVRLVLEKQAREVADAIHAALPAGVGFALYIFDFGEPCLGCIKVEQHPGEGYGCALHPAGRDAKNLAYVSNAQRGDILKMLAEWKARTS